jgi:hypothetical protein
MANWLERVRTKPFTLPEYMAICGVHGAVNKNHRSLLGTWETFEGYFVAKPCDPVLIQKMLVDLQGYTYQIHIDRVRVLLNGDQGFTNDAVALQYVSDQRRWKRFVRFVLTKFSPLLDTLIDMVASY